MALAVSGAAFGQNSPFGISPAEPQNWNEELPGGSPLGGINSKFMENRGQWDARALYRTSSPGMNYWVTRDGFVVDVYRDQRRGENLRERGLREGVAIFFELNGATGKPAPVGVGPHGAKISFLNELGAKKVGGVTGVRAFDEVRADGIVPGVNFRHYRENGSVRHDLIVRPGVNPNNLSFTVSGATGLTRLSNGKVGVSTGLGTVHLDGLFAYQMVGGVKRQVSASFVVEQQNQLRFQIGKYDPTQALVIDPLVYGTYFGGGDSDSVESVASDNSGAVFFAGTTTSVDLPVNAGPYAITLQDQDDGFIVGLTEDAYDVNYVAYIGGNFSDEIRGIAVDQYGDVWVAGISNTELGPATGEIRLNQRDVDLFGPTDPRSTIAFRFGRGDQLVQTPPISVTANATTVKAALDDLEGAPASGFEVTGGPLGTAEMVIRWRTNEAPGPLTVVNRVRPYLVSQEIPPVQDIAMEDNPDLPGLIPTFGTFTLSGNADNTAFTTPGIPFNAAGADIADTLQGTGPFADNNPLVAGLGGPLPDAPAAIGFFQNTPPGFPPVQLATMTANSTGLRGGGFDIAIPNGRFFVLRFKRSTTEVLDPIQSPTFRQYVSGGPKADLTWGGFAMRPQAPNTGSVEFILGGTTIAPMVDLITTKPEGRQAGFFVVSRVAPNSTVVNPSSGRQGYISGRLEVPAVDVTLDGNGAAYIAGTLEFSAAETLGPNSTRFFTSSGIFPGGNILRQDDAFIRKISAAGTYVYSGVFGSPSTDTGVGVATDASGNAYITGVAGGNGFPRTVGVYDDVFLGGKPYVVKINPNGTQLIWTTALRAVATPLKIRVDGRQNPHVILAAQSRPLPFPSDFITPTPNNPVLTGQEAAIDPILTNSPPNLDGALVVLNASATGAFYGSYFGRDSVGPFPSNELPTDLFIDRSGGVWTTGITDGLLNPEYITPNAFQIGPNGLGSWIVKQKIGLPVLGQLALQRTTIPGGFGANTLLQVTLRGPAPAPGVNIRLRILDPNVARFNDESGSGDITVSIPTGATQLSTPVQVFSRRTAIPTSTVIEARMDGDLVQNRLSVLPWLDNFTLASASVRGGNQVAATVRVIEPAPAGGLVINMTTDSPQFVSFPADGLVTIPAGEVSTTFFVETQGVNSTVVARLTANHAGAAVSRTLNLEPAVIRGFAIDPERVTGGERSQGIALLDGKAGSQTVVRVSQVSGPLVGFERGVLVPAGASQVAFPIGTNRENADGTATLRASLGGFNFDDTLVILSNQIESITLSQNSIEGGGSVTGTIRISRPAGLNGMNIPLQNSNPAVGTLSTNNIFIGPGQTFATFTLSTVNVVATQTVRITANKADYARPFATLTVLPFSVTIGLAVAPNSVSGGATSTGTITLNRPAPAGGFNVAVSSNSSAVGVPAVVTVPAGQSSVNFNITTTPVVSQVNATVTAAVGSNSASANLTVLPAAVIGFTFSPASVPGGSQSTGRVTLDQPAPAGGLVVNLTADQPGFVNFPSSITIPAGQTQGAFTVRTNTVTRIIAVRFTATVAGRLPVSRNLTITGTP